MPSPSYKLSDAQWSTIQEFLPPNGQRGQQWKDHRLVVDGIVTGTTGLVRDGAARVRELQSGLARAYALSLIGGATLLVLYFVVVAK